MKTKSLIFALGICVMLLSGCAASVGTGYDAGYGYYPPARAYYGRPYYARPYYYNPRPAVIVPARPYRGGYHGGDHGYHGGGGYRGGGGYHGGGGYRGGGGYHGGGHGRSR